METIQIPIVIITRDRSPRHNYLIETLDNLVRGGVFLSNHFHSLTILDDASNANYGNEIRGHIKQKQIPVSFTTHDEVAGSKGNAERAHRLLHSLSNEVTWGMVMEDDIDVCTRFLESAVNWLDKYAAEVRRLYFMGLPDISHDNHRDYYENKNFYGSQCYIVRTKDSLSIAEFLKTAGPFNNGHDTKLMKWLKKTYDKKYHKVCSPSPAFIQHIGVDSSIQKSERNKAHPHFHFIGRDKKYHRK